MLKRELEQVEFNVCRWRLESNVMPFGLGVRRVLNLLNAHYVSSMFFSSFLNYPRSLSVSLFGVHYWRVAVSFYFLEASPHDVNPINKGFTLKYLRGITNRNYWQDCSFRQKIGYRSSIILWGYNKSRYRLFIECYNLIAIRYVSGKMKCADKTSFFACLYLQMYIAYVAKVTLYFLYFSFDLKMS